MNVAENIPDSFARQLVLKSQLLDGKTKNPKGKKDIIRILNQLGYIQIDTLAVVNRSHHHTFWVRNNNYKQSILHDLQSKDREIFEYWGHAMSYFPMADYRFALPRMKNFLNPKHKWIKRNLELSKHLFDDILDRIRIEGPLSSQHFKSAKDKPRGSWWDWKPAKMALETLYWQGKLMISERRNFQKYYDLTERVLPDWVDKSMPSEDESVEYLIFRALKSMGIATVKEITRFIQPESNRDNDLQLANKNAIINKLTDLVESGLVDTVTIGRNKNIIFYALHDILNKRNRNNIKQVFFLSPFDNLVIQRDRIKTLFNFNYALECYLPEKKRKYGYFVLPVLYGEKFIARMDVKADKSTKILLIKKLVFEKDYKYDEESIYKIGRKLKSYAKFNNCNSLRIDQTIPVKYKSKINKIFRLDE